MIMSLGYNNLEAFLAFKPLLSRHGWNTNVGIVFWDKN